MSKHEVQKLFLKKSKKLLMTSFFRSRKPKLRSRPVSALVSEKFWGLGLGLGRVGLDYSPATCFHKKMIGIVLCGVSVACNSLKTMTTDKLYQRIDLYVNLHTEFNLTRFQTTLFVEFCSEKIGPRTIKLAFIKQRQNATTIAYFVLLN